MSHRGLSHVSVSILLLGAETHDSGQRYTWAMQINAGTPADPNMRRQLRPVMCEVSGTLRNARDMTKPIIIPKAVKTAIHRQVSSVHWEAHGTHSARP